MSERSRTPPPPRPLAHAPRSLGRARRRSLGVFAVVGVLVVLLGAGIVVGVLFAAARTSTPIDVERALRAGGCSLRVVRADNPRPHLEELDADVEYNTFPPSNGPHYVWWAAWAFHRTPVNQLQTVHNLEHGGIVIQYGDRIRASDVARLERFYVVDRSALVVAPLPALGDRIALVAWTARPRSDRAEDDFGEGRVALCPRFEESAFEAFRDAYRYRGPESEQLDRSLLQPGL